MFPTRYELNSCHNNKSMKMLTIAECGVLSSLSSLVVVFSWPVGGLLRWGERPYAACSCPWDGCPWASMSCECCCCCCWSIRSWEPGCAGPAIVYVGWGLLYVELQTQNLTVTTIKLLNFSNPLQWLLVRMSVATWQSETGNTARGNMTQNAQLACRSRQQKRLECHCISNPSFLGGYFATLSVSTLYSVDGRTDQW
jgi:hypothetical protein